ncbi:MAG: tail fiber domain-containing protein [Burkholderiales bacterium]
MRKVLLLTVVAIFASVTQPARAQFCPGVSPWVFDDVLASDPFCGYITWMAQNGISLGCQVIDANHRLYCPTGTVTRAAMAAFMNRLGNVRVEAVGTGPGLTGGPITGIGTINLATTQLLPTTACANGQIARWNGSAWACSTDANSGGTVTSVGSGTGLTGGPITSSGTLSIAAGYQLPQSCTNGQIPKSNGAGGWTCAADANSGGTVTSITAGNGLTGGTITTSGTIAVDPASTTLTNNFFRQGGNAFGTLPNATAVLGTTNTNALDIRVNGLRVMRYEPNAISPNVIGGSPANSVTAGVRGATIGGGGIVAALGDPDFGLGLPNRVTDAYGTVGGGWGNIAGDDAGTVIDHAFATIGGGFFNAASGKYSTVGGGFNNTASGLHATAGGGAQNIASGLHATVGGGDTNAASGERATVGGGRGNTASWDYATVGGGLGNTASGGDSSVGGGYNNTASGGGSSVIGGRFNTASGPYSSVIGGWNNTASGYAAIAGGYGAQADLSRCFVFGGWSNGTTGANCLGTSNVVRFMVDHGFSVDYQSARPDGGGTRWVYIGDMPVLPGGSYTIQAWNGAVLTDGGSWTNVSDRARKEGFRAIDPQEVLASVVGLPVTRWRYRTEPEGVEHIGPTAQDFYAAFGLGQSDTTIGTVDSEGVALAAIQGLNAKLEARVAEQSRELDAQRSEIASLKAVYATEVAELKRAVELLLARTSPEGRIAAK